MLIKSQTPFKIKKIMSLKGPLESEVEVRVSMPH